MISRNAGGIAMGASTMLNRVNTLVKGTSSMFHHVGYGEELDNDLQTDSVCGYPTDEVRGRPSGYTDLGTSWGTKTEGPYTDLRSSFANSETWAKPNLGTS